ncbi:DNA-directed RNA polymerase subunit D [Candidatus Micrarchaeota archaeon]|nr:DNA-directed RNA polymerase subunit D [Candidatus Micrarchaeota archaeon]
MTVSITNVEEKKENVLELTLKGTDLKFANLLRRYIISSVPVLAIDGVVFYENSSAFFDEYVSHRLGLIPVSTPKSTAKSAELTVILDERGPKKVYSGDLKSEGASIAVPDIPIITLGEDESVRLEAKIILGNGKTHAKFQAGTASYELKNNGDIVFKVESFFQMRPKDLIVRALELIEKDMDSISKKLK